MLAVIACNPKAIQNAQSIRINGYLSGMEVSPIKKMTRDTGLPVLDMLR